MEPAAVAEALRAAGIPVGRAETVPPSLEDVFVSVVLERERRTGPHGEVRR
jgi:hypothetical protein